MVVFWSYLIEVPYSEGQSSPWRIVRLPLAISVACDIQVHSVLNILLKTAPKACSSAWHIFCLLMIKYQIITTQVGKVLKKRWMSVSVMFQIITCLSMRSNSAVENSPL